MPHPDEKVNTARQIIRSHAAAADLPLDDIAIVERREERRQRVLESYAVWRPGHKSEIRPELPATAACASTADFKMVETAVRPSFDDASCTYFNLEAQVKRCKLHESTTFPGEIWAAPRSWDEAVYPGLAYFNTVERGGHFAALEEPSIFVSEVRAAFASLR